MPLPPLSCPLLARSVLLALAHPPFLASIAWAGSVPGGLRALAHPRRGPGRHRRPPPAHSAQGPSLRRHPLAGGGMSPHVAPPRSYPPLSPSRAACRAAGAVSLRSTPPFTPFADAHIRSGPPSYDAEGGTGSGHPATSALTGSISGIDRASVPSLGKKGETTNTQTSVGKQNGLVLFTEIFLNYRPSGIWGSYVDSPHLKPPTIHARGRFPGWSTFGAGRGGARRHATPG